MDLSSTLIEAAYAHIVGTQNFFLYMFDEPEMIKGVLDGLTQYYTELGLNAIKMGVDMIRVGDDIGAQQSMMVSPKQWRELAQATIRVDVQRVSESELRSCSSSCIPAGTTRPSSATRSSSAWISPG